MRIGTKMPVVLPQRVTRVDRVLKTHHPLWMSLHFTHPAERTPEVTEATPGWPTPAFRSAARRCCSRASTTTVDMMKPMMHGLLMRRVRPYYLYQCDPISGSAHFRTPRRKGLEIIHGLRGHTTGYAVPTTSSTRPAAAARSRSSRTMSSAARATTCC